MSSFSSGVSFLGTGVDALGDTEGVVRAAAAVPPMLPSSVPNRRRDLDWSLGWLFNFGGALCWFLFRNFPPCGVLGLCIGGVTRFLVGVVGGEGREPK